MRTWLVAYKEDYPHAMWRIVAETAEDAIRQLCKLNGARPEELIAW